MDEEILRAEKLSSDDRRERLSAQNNERHLNLGYSSFIRRMKIILPLAAICIIAVLMSWQTFQSDSLAPQPASETNNREVSRNELVNPRFDSVDDKGQPYTITADAATQTEADKDLMMLDAPFADLILNDGGWIALKAEKGAYKQETGHILLTDNVTLFHDSGYRLKVSQLDINMKDQNAWSNAIVEAQGPKAMLDAKGLRADSENETLIFKGPAKLILFDLKGGL